MKQLLSRQATVEAFTKLAAEYYNVPESYASIIERLPPYLCQQLALNKSYPFDEGLKYAYTGKDRLDLRWSKEEDTGQTIAMVEGKGIESLTSRLPLNGHRQAVDPSKVNDYTVEALEQMEALEPERLGIVEDWTSLIVWLEQAPDADITVLTSSTFPLLPHCTFLTEKARRHIPPSSVAEKSNDYALRENIYHEALHQQIAATLLHQDVLNPEYSAARSHRVPIPWRGNSWEPDRALHATVVYTGLMAMREDELKRDISTWRRTWLEEATVEAHESLSYLVGRLEERTDLFTPAGEDLFDSLRSDAMGALEAVSI